MEHFSATIDIIGINPFVFIPDKILEEIFVQAKQRKGSIRVMGTINGEAYTQTLIRYSGYWRLYINTNMLKDSPRRIGERIAVSIAFNPDPKEMAMHPGFYKALVANKKAKAVFDRLSPSYQSEIIRYITQLKTAPAVEKNITRAINFLLGKERFIGRDKP